MGDSVYIYYVNFYVYYQEINKDDFFILIIVNYNYSYNGYFEVW